MRLFRIYSVILMIPIETIDQVDKHCYDARISSQDLPTEDTKLWEPPLDVVALWRFIAAIGRWILPKFLES
jgi:hypothetical protein